MTFRRRANVAGEEWGPRFILSRHASDKKTVGRHQRPRLLPISSISSLSELPIPTGCHCWPNQDFLVKSLFPISPRDVPSFLSLFFDVSKPSMIKLPRRVFRAYKPRVLQSLIIYRISMVLDPESDTALTGEGDQTGTSWLATSQLALSPDTKSANRTRKVRHTSSESKDKGNKRSRITR